ncbi:MAG: hypothetical protein ACTSUB_02805 [Candidatus Thorarchaeota archaeon]
MKIVERLLDLFGSHRKTLLGATTQPSDLIAHIYAIRARAYLKITGKHLTTVDISTIKKNSTSMDSTKDLSPSRRLLRRGL